MWPVSEEHKEWARQRMAELDMTQADLSRAVGISTAAVAQFFGTGQEQSRHWPAIVAALGGTPPKVTDPRGYTDDEIDEYRRTIASGWHLLTDEERRAVADLVQTLTSRRR